jgi:hypothetical protein
MTAPGHRRKRHIPTGPIVRLLTPRLLPHRSRILMKCLTLAYCLGIVWSIAALPGCSDPVDPDGEWERRIGVIDIGSFLTPPIELPETVEQGVPFTATVVTFGSSSCVRQDGAEIHVNGLTAYVRPYDFVAVGAERVCTDDLEPHPREVTLQFDQAGEATVLVFGRTQQGASTQYEARVPVVSPAAAFAPARAVDAVSAGR